MVQRIYRFLSVLCFVIAILSLVPEARAADNDGCNKKTATTCEDKCPAAKPFCHGTTLPSGNHGLVCPQCTAT